MRTGSRGVSKYIAAAGLAFLAANSAGAANSTRAADVKVKGDYVEARTARVFAGACHYNGELTTTGRDVEMIWALLHKFYDSRTCFFPGRTYLGFRV